MKIFRTTLACVAAVALLGGLIACGGDAEDSVAEPTSSAPASTESVEEPSESASESSPDEVVITIEDFEYSDPGPVAPGTEITVENTDDSAHTVTTDGEGDIDVTIAPGETATFTAPDQPGEYPYVCTFHAGMTGTLVVE